MFVCSYCRRTEQYLWKLDRTENFSRMRMRLARNYNFDTHEDASRLRDTGLSSDSFPSKEKSNTQLLAKVTKRQSSSLEEEDVLLEQLWSDANSPALREDGQEDPSSTDLKEKLVKGVQCYLIMLMEKIPGRLEITSKHLFFLSDQSEKNQTQTCKWILHTTPPISHTPYITHPSPLGSSRVQYGFQDPSFSDEGDSL